MRQRRIKNLDDKLEPLSYLVVDGPEEQKGKWLDCFAGTDQKESGDKAPDLYVEIGCGKGKFVTGMAMAHPDSRYLAFEGHLSVVYHALKRADRAVRSGEMTDNVRFVTSYLHEPGEVFERGELSGIYLNFSDPWPKARHEKRRLTAGRMMESYVEAVRSGGMIEFRTDNDDLFDYTMEVASELAGAEIIAVSRDLHAELRDVAARMDLSFLEEAAFEEGADDEQDSARDLMVTSEYEDKFSKQEKSINYLALRII